MTELLLLLASFHADAEAFCNHLPPHDVCAAYSDMTWDDPDQRASWFWYWAHESRKDYALRYRLYYAIEAYRMITPGEWAAQRWPVPAWWRNPPPTGRYWR